MENLRKGHSFSSCEQLIHLLGGYIEILFMSLLEKSKSSIKPCVLRAPKNIYFGKGKPSGLDRNEEVSPAAHRPDALKGVRRHNPSVASVVRAARCASAAAAQVIVNYDGRRKRVLSSRVDESGTPLLSIGSADLNGIGR